MTDAILDRIKEATKPKPRKAVKLWDSPRVADYAPNTCVLAFDQTLTHTGWAILDTYDAMMVPAVRYTGMLIAPPSELKGLELTLWRAQWLGMALDEMLLRDVRVRDVHVVVHEMPAVRGHRLESSLMAAREIRRSVSLYMDSILLMAVYNQAMKATLLPPEERNSKAAVKGAVLRHASLDLLPKGSRLNEHVYDAMGLGLTSLIQQKRAAS